jgi:hypothetical protein
VCLALKKSRTINMHMEHLFLLFIGSTLRVSVNQILNKKRYGLGGDFLIRIVKK